MKAANLSGETQQLQTHSAFNANPPTLKSSVRTRQKIQTDKKTYHQIYYDDAKKICPKNKHANKLHKKHTLDNSVRDELPPATIVKVTNTVTLNNKVSRESSNQEQKESDKVCECSCAKYDVHC